jgi:hypothetical protein
MVGMDHPLDGWWAAQATDQHVNLLPGARWTDVEAPEPQPALPARPVAA